MVYIVAILYCLYSPKRYVDVLLKGCMVYEINDE